MAKVRADEIKRALSKRHGNDVFLTEVKTGPTTIAAKGELQIIDAVAMKKSWTAPLITAYEVKVARSDFLRDDKWQGYRAYCHRLYFACPTGLIEREELPDDVGLVWYNPETEGLFTRKPAVTRQIDLPTSMFYHLLISHTHNDRHPFFGSRREMLLAWLEDKVQRKYLGSAVGTRLAEEVEKSRERIEALERQLERKEKAAQEFERILEIMGQAGIRTHYSWQREEDLKQRLTAGVTRQLRTAVADLSLRVADIAKMMASADAPTEKAGD